jgi:hypothetical protein
MAATKKSQFPPKKGTPAKKGNPFGGKQAPPFGSKKAK